MKIKTGIFWGGADLERSYLSANAILQKLDHQIFDPVLFFVDESQAIFPVSLSLFSRKGKPNGATIAPQQLAQEINIAFLELWDESSWPILSTFDALGIPYIGHPASLREPGSAAAAPAAGKAFSCMVLHDFDGTPVALYPTLDAADDTLLTQLQLDQIRSQSIKVFEQLDLAPFALIKGWYTRSDHIFFDSPELAYPLENEGYLSEQLAHYHWSADQVLVYAVLASLRQRFREKPEQKAYEALFEHILLQKQQSPSIVSPISIIIGADGPEAAISWEAARYFTEVSASLTEENIAVFECLSAKNAPELRQVKLSELGYSTEWKKDPLFLEIMDQMNALGGQVASAAASQKETISLGDLQTEFVYLCLSGKFTSGFLQYGLDELKIAHSGSSLPAIRQVGHITSSTPRFEPGMAHLRSSVWCKGSAAHGNCQVIGHSLIEKDGTLVTPARKQLLVMNDAEVRGNIQNALKNALENCNLRSYVIVESYLRIFEDNSVQLSIVEVNTAPLLTSDHPIFAQAADIGLSPKAVFSRLLDPVISKPTLVSQTLRSEPLMVNEEELEPTQQEPSQPTNYSETPEADNTTPAEEPGFFAKTWQATKAFITSPIFLRNLAGIVVASLLLFTLLTVLLRLYTRHGSDQVVVDKYLEMNFSEAKRQARGKDLRAVVIDSTFVINMPPNIVIEQDPKPGSKVKKRRTVYLWVTGGQAPDVLLPGLAGKDDFETYRRELDRRGIQLTIKERQFDRKLEENTILGFYYQESPVSVAQVNSGFKVPKGSKMEAIVSKRSDGNVNLPDLVCQTFEAAQFALESNQLKLGEVYGTRSDQAYVWKQEPAYEPGVRIPIGSTIVLHLTAEVPEGCE